ncbi:MAG: ATP-dependent DNA helicase [Actinomycetota bacterium]
MLGNSVRGAHLVVGPPGSGKTRLLRDRFAALVREGEQGILMLVPDRRVARALGDHILRDVGRSTSEVRVTTWHAFALSLLRFHYPRLGYRREPSLLTGPEQFNLVREMLADPLERQRWAEFRTHTALTGFVEELREFVLRAQDAFELPEDIERRATELGRPDLAEAARFFRRYLERIDVPQDSLVDHANAIARAVHLLRENSDIAVAVRAQARHILVDDYQNVTPAQESLLRELAIGADSVVVAADPDARIFGFRGSSAHALDDFRKRFAPVGESHLSELHRMPSRTDAWLFDHLSEEASAVASECMRLHVREGIGYGEIAVVVRRYGAAFREVCRSLRRAGVPLVTVSEDRPLAREPALAPVLDLARAALRPAEREERLARVLASPVARLDAHEVRALRREARLRRTTLDGLLAAPPEDLPERLVAALREVGSLLEEIADCARRETRPAGVFWFLWKRLPLFDDLVAQGDDDALDAVAAFAEAIERFSDRRPGMGFDDYLDALEGVEFGPEPWRMPEVRRPDAVRVMTAHHAAGTEFEAVIVAGCVEGEFPDPHERRVLFDVRDVLAPATPQQRRAARMQEERRLFTVATTRARRRLLMTGARESSRREASVPSPLVRATGAEWERPPQTEPLTRDEVEAHARRAMRDATVPPDARRAALDVLARLPGVRPERWWYEREWSGPGVPLVPGELRTSYSRLSAYDNCGLQYLYSVELGLDPASSHQMQVGSWVHDIVDLCARGEIPMTPAALIEALDKVWDPSIFDGIAMERQRRKDSEKMLRRWLEVDGELETLASEVWFEFPVNGAVVRGRIDRVVRCGNSMLRLIDYKTGRNAKSQEEIREDLQLATYYLALTTAQELVGLGEPRYLELAYLGAQTRDGFIRRGLDPRRIEGYAESARARLESFVAGIHEERFSPAPGADCAYCKFKSICPVWPEGDEVRL